MLALLKGAQVTTANAVAVRVRLASDKVLLLRISPLYGSHRDAISTCLGLPT